MPHMSMQRCECSAKMRMCGGLWECVSTEQAVIIDQYIKNAERPGSRNACIPVSAGLYGMPHMSMQRCECSAKMRMCGGLWECVSTEQAVIIDQYIKNAERPGSRNACIPVSERRSKF